MIEEVERLQSNRPRAGIQQLTGIIVPHVIPPTFTSVASG